VRQAYEFNLPLRVSLAGPQARGARSYMQIDAVNGVVETVKRAEDGAELIVRLYESAGIETETVLRFGFPVQKAAEVDLMEQPLRALTLQGDALHLRLRPFEILSLRLSV